MKGHRSYHEFIWLICCLLCAVVKSLPQQESNWGSQCEDVKRILFGLDSKMTFFENKMTDIKILDYAYKINTIDNQLSVMNANMEALKVGAKDHATKLSAMEQVSRTSSPASDVNNLHWETLNTRLNQMDLKMDSMQDAIKNLKDCSQNEERRRTSNIIEWESNSNELVTKLDDYGRKLIKNHEDIQEEGKQHRQDITGLMDVVRNGFNKVILKIDKTLEIEGQVTNVNSILQQVSAKTTSLDDQIVKFLTELLKVQEDVTENHKLLSNLSKTLNKSLEKTEIFPVADLTRAMEIGKDLEPQLTRLSALEGKIEKTKALSSQLVSTSKDALLSDFHTVALNLSNFLNEIQEMSLPLFYSVPYNFQNIQAHVADALTFLRNKTQCHSNQVVQLEVQRLKSGMQQVVEELRNSSKAAGEGFQRGNIPSMRNSVFRATEDIRLALREVKSRHLLWSDDEDRKQIVFDCAIPVISKYHEKLGAYPEDLLIGLIGTVCEIAILALSIF